MLAFLRGGGERVARRGGELAQRADERGLDLAGAGGDHGDVRALRVEDVGRVDDAARRGEEELVAGLAVELEVDLGTEQAAGVAGADDDVLTPTGSSISCSAATEM